MRFIMVATYFGVIVVTLILMCIYVVGLLRDNLYNTEKVDMFAKANIIAMTISDQWTDNAQLSELRFGDVVDKKLAGTSIRGIVADTAYTVIYDSSRESEMVGKAFMRDALKRAVDGEQNDVITDDDGVRLMSVAVPVEKDDRIIGGVYLAKTIGGIDNTINSTSVSLIVFSVMIVIIIGMLSFGISYIITSPLAEFTRAAREISKGNFKYRISVRGSSEMTQMAATLNYMCDELNMLEEKRRKFVSDASHELKTPMAGIKLICDSLVEAPDTDSDMIREFLSDMSEEVDRLTRIINRLLALTRLDNGGTALRPEETDMSAMLDRIAGKLGGFAAEKNISIVKRYKDMEIGPIVVDYDKIYEAIYNITDNAVKYTPNGGSVYIDLQPRDDFVVIKIEDTGEGIQDSEKERVFERFYRVDDSRARTTGGTGLGLAIAKEAVMLHGGEIEIADGADGGCVFIVILPITAERR